MKNDFEGLIWHTSGGEWDTEREMDGITLYGSRDKISDVFEVMAYTIEDFGVFFDEHLTRDEVATAAMLGICDVMGWGSDLERLRFMASRDRRLSEILIGGWIDDQNAADPDAFGWIDRPEDC